jgi:hypothetical protein
MQFTYEVAVHHPAYMSAVSRVTGGPYSSLPEAASEALRRVLVEFDGEHLVKVYVYDGQLLAKTIQVI